MVLEAGGDYIRLLSVTLVNDADNRAGSLVTILEPHNYTLLYAYETLEILSIYQALSGKRFSDLPQPVS